MLRWWKADIKKIMGRIHIHLSGEKKMVFKHNTHTVNIWIYLYWSRMSGYCDVISTYRAGIGWYNANAPLPQI